MPGSGGGRVGGGLAPVKRTELLLPRRTSAVELRLNEAPSPTQRVVTALVLAASAPGRVRGTRRPLRTWDAFELKAQRLVAPLGVEG